MTNINSVDGRDMKRLRMFDKITPVYHTAETYEPVEGKSFRIGILSPKVGEAPIMGGVSCRFEVFDIYGKCRQGEILGN